MRQLLLFFFMVFPVLGFTQLTGYWQTENGGCYQIRQKGNEVWWTGESSDNQRSANVFRGAVAGANLTGIWCDMPSNTSQGCGESISLRLENNNRMVKVASSAPYNGRIWTRQNGPCTRCALTMSNLPSSFKILVPGTAKYSLCSRIGNSNEYNEELFDGSTKYAVRKLKVYTNQQNRLVLENIDSNDGWYCTFTGDAGDNCSGDFVYKKAGETGGSARYTIDNIQP